MKYFIIYITTFILSLGFCQSQNLDEYPSGLLTTLDKFQGKRANGIVTIDYIAGNTKLTKPLIVVEGIDLTAIIEPEGKGYGEIDYTDFKKAVNFGGNKLRDLIYDNSSKKYDIVYLDFKDGADDMRRNALLVQELIRWVNYKKAEAGSTEPNVVLGQSMGGVVARYALADMEEKGLVHDTRLFISHDAPQQGRAGLLSSEFALISFKIKFYFC